jgi:predicted ester cyclase
MASVAETMERVFRTWNARDKSAWMALLDPDLEIVLPGGVQLAGVEGANIFYALWHDAFPDNRLEPRRMIGEGDAVVVEAIFHGTHTGALNLPSGAVPPTNKRVSIPYVVIGTAVGSTFTRLNFYYDQVEVLTQLGLMPAPVPA